jgi:TonB family protein
MTRSNRSDLRRHLLRVAFVLTPGVLVGQEGEVGTGGVKGTLRDPQGLPIAGAQVTVAGTTLVGESDDRGEFTLAKARAGETSIRVKRIGFLPDTVRVNVLAGQTVPVEITLSRVAVELSPLVVYGRRNMGGHMSGFYDRLTRGGGHFFTREQIERRNPVNMTDLFRLVPGARVVNSNMGSNAVRFRNARCAPLVWLDGTPAYSGELPLDALDPRTFEGIEIYSGPAGVPAEYMGNRSMSSSCGTIILWSRQGELRPRRPKKGAMTPAALIEQLVTQQTVFTADDVDQPARPDSSDLIQPVYPDSMFDSAIGGRATVEFVVDLSGTVVIETFSVVTTTHAAFAEAVRRAVKDQRYIPARRKGLTVQQVVQQPFDFIPDSTAARRRRR